MSVLSRISSALGHGDGLPNLELAQALCREPDPQAIRELVDALGSPTARVASDCLEVLEEIGKLEPHLIAPYVQQFLALLSGRNNRLVWGAMVALSTIATDQAAVLARHLPILLQALETGSVITVDNAVSVLAAVSAALPSTRPRILPRLVAHLASCRPKDVAQHAERCAIAATTSTRAELVAVLQKRLPELTEAQSKRVGKVIAMIERGGGPQRTRKARRVSGNP